MKKKPSKRVVKAPKAEQRGYKEVASVGGGINNDWPVSWIGEDADVYNNAWALTSRVRDLFRSNPMYQAYRETLWANVFGSEGLMLRMRVKETEDRVVNSPEEKQAIRAFEERRNRVLEFFAAKEGHEFKALTMLRVLGKNGSARASVKIGEPDVYANTIIERRWKEWQRKEYSDTRGTRNYNTHRQLRLISAVRDGDCFIRMVKDPRVNKFGFSLQLINAEWCDRFLNCELPNGNVVRMGMEYEMKPWGLGKWVAAYFIKRQANDWQYSVAGMFNFSTGGIQHDRIPSEELIHYARAVDADGTRPAPWVAATIPKARQLDQYELAEVIAARMQACKTGWLYSDIVAEGGAAGVVPDPRTGIPSQALTPGGIGALPYGVKYQANDPTHPNGNFESFRKGMVRSQCAGMPGSNYSTMANDYEAINFSAGRLQRLDSNELFKLIQTFDIDYAETPIFENWLEMSLMTGAIPLPLSKFEKFNKKVFQGRRWQGVDEVKEATAAALRVANGFSSDQRECADKGLDLEELLFDQAESQMLKEQLGLNTMKTVETPGVASQIKPDEEEDIEEEEETEEEPPKPAEKKKAKTKSRL